MSALRRRMWAAGKCYVDRYGSCDCPRCFARRPRADLFVIVAVVAFIGAVAYGAWKS